MSMLNLFRRSACLRDLIGSFDLHLIDIGARGGLDHDLLPAAWAIHATGFEPAEQECARLNQLPSDPWKSACYVPTAVGGMDRADSKYVTGARAELLSSGSMAAVIPSPCPKPQPLQPISI
jgi:hypothetical protein